VLSRRDELLAEHRDRPLAGLVDVGERPALRAARLAGVHRDAARLELLARAAAELVAGERREEETRPREAGELDGRDGAAAGGRPRPGRRSLPGDGPARTPRVRTPRARRRAARVGADDRGERGHRRGAAGATDGRAGGRACGRGPASRRGGARSPDGRPAAEGARGRRPSLRLRPRLRRDRRRPRLERAGGAAGGLRRRAAAAEGEGAAMTPATTQVPTVLDERFRAAAAVSGDLDVAYDL